MKRSKRVYRKKGPEALSAKLDITVTQSFRDKVSAKAEKAGLPITEFCRDILVAAIEA